MAEVKVEEEQNHGPDWEPNIKEEPESPDIKEEPEESPFHIITVKTKEDPDGASVVHQREESNADDSDTDHSEDYSQEQAPKNKMSYVAIPPDSSSLSCSVCVESFRNKSEVKRHMSSVHGEWTHKCPLCEKNFLLKHHLNKHMKCHIGEKSFVCSVCKERFGNSTALSVHQTRAHHICRVCFNPVTESLTAHLKAQEKEGFFSCSDCGTSSRGKADLQRHSLLVHGKEKPYKCSDDSNIAHSKNFRPEQAPLTPDSCVTGHGPFSGADHKPFTCSECGRTFRYLSQVNRHMLCVHSGKRPHKCSICDKTFSLKCNLKTHIKSHSREKPFICSVCGEGFVTWFGHSQHQRLVHHICPVCFDSFTEKKTLNDHLKGHGDKKSVNEQLKVFVENKSVEHQKDDIKEVTEGQMVVQAGEPVQPFSCLDCGKSFRSMFQLQSHIADHTRERLLKQEVPPAGNKVQCPLCEKSFVSSYLHLHLQRVHFMCPLCPEQFPDEKRLEEHLKSHEEAIKPFSCSECGERFRVKSHLQSHLKTHKVSKPKVGLRTLAPRLVLNQGVLLVSHIHTEETIVTNEAQSCDQIKRSLSPTDLKKGKSSC